MKIGAVISGMISAALIVTALGAAMVVGWRIADGFEARRAAIAGEQVP